MDLSLIKFINEVLHEEIIWMEQLGLIFITIFNPSFLRSILVFILKFRKNKRFGSNHFIILMLRRSILLKVSFYGYILLPDD